MCQALLTISDIKSAKDIEDALKDLLGGAIQEMLESEMDEHLGYQEYERSSNPDYRKEPWQIAVSIVYCKKIGAANYSSHSHISFFITVFEFTEIFSQSLIEALKTMVWRYFMSYWSNRRICSSIGGIPPAVKRRRFYSALTIAA